jgi:hypothetical protein
MQLKTQNCHRIAVHAAVTFGDVLLAGSYSCDTVSVEQTVGNFGVILWSYKIGLCTGPTVE